MYLGKNQFSLCIHAVTSESFLCAFWIAKDLKLIHADNNDSEQTGQMLRLISLSLRTRHEPPHDKTNEMACAPSEDSDQPGYPPSLIRVFAVCMKKAGVLIYPLSAQRRLSSDWADALADPSLRCGTVILLVLSCCGSHN